MMRKLIVLGAVAVALVWTPGAKAALIELDFSTDTGGFFSANPAARSALEAAAADLSNLITTPLNATVDSNSVTSGTETATFNHSFNYTHPSSGAPSQGFNPAVVDAGVIHIFAGARNLTSLGVGGPGGAGTSGGGSLVDSANFALVVTEAAAASSANLTRGGGPVIGTISGSLGSAAFSIDYGLGIGGISFDTDADWHFDHTTTVATGKSDFYSVALHELMHALGIGASKSWDGFVGGDGNDWLGPNVITLVGSGNDLIHTEDFAHLTEGTISQVFGTDTRQEAAIDPTLTTGQRKFITDLDVALLRDIGWNIGAFTIIPEPASISLLAGAALVLLGRRPRRRC